MPIGMSSVYEICINDMPPTDPISYRDEFLAQQQRFDSKIKVGVVVTNDDDE